MRNCLFALVFFSFALIQAEELHPVIEVSNQDSDEIYWERPEYLAKLDAVKTAGKVQYVYHRQLKGFIGNYIVPLNLMPQLDGFSELHKLAISKYEGREKLLSRVIPTLNCLWNDVIFLSPVHPHKHYEEYIKDGFTPKQVFFYKIPIEVLEEKRVTVWKWLSNKKYPEGDPIHNSLESYCDLDFDKYQEMDDLPNDTKEFYSLSFDSADPSKYPRFNWYRIPHILCQDPIDVSDDRITLIDWKDPID